MSTKLGWGLEVSLQIDHLIGTSALAPQRPMVTAGPGSSWVAAPLSLSLLLYLIKGLTWNFIILIKNNVVRSRPTKLIVAWARGTPVVGLEHHTGDSTI
ncbi:hypothetical protein TNCV_3554891 [Trichonephila clavipes]|nr:hypothetical protein TNCV_3554891 [Trichonephila clavipes]